MSADDETSDSKALILAKIGGGEGHRKLEMACTTGGISYRDAGSGDSGGVDFFSAEDSYIMGIKERQSRTDW